MERGSLPCAGLAGPCLVESWACGRPGALSALPLAWCTLSLTVPLLAPRALPPLPLCSLSTGGEATVGSGASLVVVGGPGLRECGCMVRLPGPYCRARELDPRPAPMPPDNSVSVNGAGHPYCDDSAKKNKPTKKDESESDEEEVSKPTKTKK